MKMDDMVTWLEKRGFKAKKGYSALDKAYHFRIERNGNELYSIYKWPEDQIKFLERFVDAFERTYPKKPEHTGLVTTGSKREWTDPVSGKTFSYDWGFDTGKAKEDKTGYYLTDCRNDKSMIITKENDMTIREVYNTLTGTQKAAVEKMVSEAMNTNDAPQIKNVKFNPPATIVFWTDNTKTVVKCQEGDIFDPEKGLAMAYMKKSMGNKGNYFNEVKKWTEKYEAECLLERIKEIDEWHSAENASIFAKIYAAVMSGMGKSECELIHEKGLNLAEEFEKSVNEVTNENAE